MALPAKTNCEQIVRATVVLHNYLQKEEANLPLRYGRYCPTACADYVDQDGMFHYGQWHDAAGGALYSVRRSDGNNASHITRSLRDRLANYFSSEQGEIP